MYLRGLIRSGRLTSAVGHLACSILPNGNVELARQVPRMLRRYRSRKQSGESDASGEIRSMLGRLMAMSEQERRIHEIRYQYLPRLLKWDDRNFMAFAVEGRYPFLDHEVIETALAIAPDALYAAGWTKEPLRRGLAALMPSEIVRRRTKVAFQTPQDGWLRGALRPAIEEMVRGDSPAWELVPREQAARVAREAWEAPTGHEEAGQALFRLFCVDRWLRQLDAGAPAALEQCRASSY
jgi:asparagine synthase (glutamine-hydrolysing)